jgi:hypothetical protein
MSREPERVDVNPRQAVRAMEELAAEIRALRAELRDLRATVRAIVDGAKGSAVGASVLGLLARMGRGR